MLLNLSDVLTTEGKVEQKEAEIEMSCFKSKMGDFQITKKSSVVFTLTNMGQGKAILNGEANLSFQAICDRCLDDVEVPMNLCFERIFVAPDHEEAEEIDTNAFMEGYQLDVEMLMYHEILENWPVKILCREDCKGVCTVCGKNLNQGDCGCDRFVPDPRMAVIKDIFERNKEV